MYKDKFEKNSIVIEVEISEDDGNTTIKTVTTVKDKDIFPTLNVENKAVMDRVLDIIANHQRVILSTREFWLNRPKETKKKEMTIVCRGCNKPFKWAEPCCGEPFDTECPHCGKKEHWEANKNPRRDKK